MMRAQLREAMEERRRHTGERLLSDRLATRTGLAQSTIESIATRGTYSTRLGTIPKLCTALDCAPGYVRALGDVNGPESRAD